MKKCITLCITKIQNIHGLACRLVLNATLGSGSRTKKYYQLVQKTQKYKNLKGLDENLGLFSYGVSVRGKPGLAFYCDEVAIDVPTSMPNHRHGQNQA